MAAAKKTTVNKSAKAAAPAAAFAPRAAVKAVAASKPVAVLPTMLAKPVTAKPAKARKPKLVRDSFTIPRIEYGVLEELKQRAGALASPAKKSELLRAGIKALAAMPDGAFKAALQAVPAIKTGRPARA